MQACNKDQGFVKIITETDDEDNLVMRVKDNGMGIPKDKLGKIFEAFYSTKEAGTGLGLASAKRIIERHDGMINRQSEVNVGTEIIMSIPKLQLEDE
jgi:signal transduction histidine kinase